MAEFTRDQVARLSDSLLKDMEEAHSESRSGSEELLGFVRDEIAVRAIGLSSGENSAYLSYDKQSKETCKNPHQD